MKHTVEKHRVDYGTVGIEFSLERRRRKSLGIYVYPDGAVKVVAPAHAPMKRVLETVKKRASWICKKQLEFSRLPPRQPKPQYQSGETFRYLGKQYRLKVLAGAGDGAEVGEGDGRGNGKPGVKLKQGRFHLTAPESYSSEQRGTLLRAWFRERGEHIFEERFRECIKTTVVIGIREVPPWSIKAMSTRWGSCTSRGKIYLNPELLAAPKPCIDYVILHELCHLRELNHSPRFYALLTKVYPEWKKWRTYLNENIEVRMT